MTGSIESMRNLGPMTVRMLAEVGIETEEDLRKIGAVDAYARLRFASERPVSLNALYAMYAALGDAIGATFQMRSRQR